MEHTPRKLNARSVTRALKNAGLLRADYAGASGFTTRAWADYHNGYKRGTALVSVTFTHGIRMQDVAHAIATAIAALTAAGYTVTQPDNKTLNVTEVK